jgi:DNA-directed RNA polymerase specialized sigma24 family protein
LTASNLGSYTQFMDSLNSLICGSVASPPTGPTSHASPESFDTGSIDSTDSPTAARQQLVKIREDPRMRSLAVRIARDHDLADDALQRAYYAVVRRKKFDQIENLWAYFRRVLINEVHRERHQLGAALVDDFERVAEARQDATGYGPASPPCVEAAVCLSLQAQSWLKRFADRRDVLLAAVPARSDDPVYYRALIYSAAEQVLRDGIHGEPSEADGSHALRAAYPEYFDQLGASPATCYQRFCRARTDVRDLLKAVVSRDELF